MGDTGSLALGGSIAAISILVHQEWLLLLIGIIFVIETASVILQVFYFKATGGKRIFRMTPIHHHFELGGWSEWRVVLTFWGIGLIGAIISVCVVIFLIMRRNLFTAKASLVSCFFTESGWRFPSFCENHKFDRQF